MISPADPGTQIFHITHVDNLPSIARTAIHCDVLVRKIANVRGIAYRRIKEERARTQVPVGPLGTLADYVPFYFAPRSPMLYTISLNNVEGARGTHAEIVHLVLSIESVAASSAGFVFTSGHAIMALSEFFTDLTDLPKLDWRSIRTRRWGTYYDNTGETKRKKQSEFLVFGSVPWAEVQAIGVMTPECGAKVTAALRGVAHQPPVYVRPDWYY